MNTQTLRSNLKTNFLLLAIAILIGFTCQQCTRPVAIDQNEEKQEVIPVKITSETVRELVQPIEVTGMVIASKQQRLSFKTGGIIEKILVSEGQSVKKGQLLATLKLDEIEAQVHQSHLGLEKAQRDFDRIQNLFNDSVATLEQFQNVTTALELAKSNVKIAEYNRRYSKIEAPTNGHILMKISENHELTAPGIPVLVMASNDEEWQVTTGITDKDVVRVSMFDMATVNLDAYPNEHLQAEVCQIGDAPDPITGMYEVKLSLVANKLQLKPGFFAQVEITPNKKQSYLTIPVNAVTEGIGNTVTYFSLSADKTQAIKKIAKVEWIQNDMVVLNSSIEKTDLIVVACQKELNHLALVEVIESTTKTGKLKTENEF